MSGILEIKSIRCGYEDETVVDDFTLSLRDTTLNCLLGPSGCGKTTVLRAIAGFEPISRGEIILNEQVVSSRDFTMPPEQRGIGMVFQDYALFPHLSVGDNVSFGLRQQTKSKKRKIAEEMLELVGLEEYLDRFPHELSGGQQQRIAVARALAPEPPLILMDEPFSNLDVDLRERLVLDVREILRQRQTTTLFVTHDQDEAFIMGEHVAVMNEGRIMQWDMPYTLYHEPSNRFVADFIGQGRLIEGVLTSHESVETSLGLLAGNRSYEWPSGTRVDVLLRPDDVLMDVEEGVDCLITDRHFKGAQIMYVLRTPRGDELLSLVPSHLDITPGQKVKVGVDSEHLVVFRQ
ncbi:MAG: ABC transporter ATP-binding protein [Gammaproteobacteria bacterium]|nr:MAG: ABC transporter ATP-binding protein [Gammaproteobacteria bacterium]